MTREEKWKEFENQLITETRTPVTMSYDDAEILIKLGIKETVAKWKRRLEQTRWIPVSERLPETGCYLVCCDDGYVATIWYDRARGWLLDSKIIAWMPLPQPYKAESEDKCKNCKYYRNPDYTRCHECETEREDKE